MSYPADDPKTPKSIVVFYKHQRTIQTILLIVAVICIPWLLIGKPIYIIVQRKKKTNVNEKEFLR